jgi:hypothetical protein
MKLLLFFYFICKFGGEYHNKEVGDDDLAVKITFAIVGFPMLMTIYVLLDNIGLMTFLSENWFFDYGRMHARNYFSPIGIFSMITMTLLYLSFKRLINQDKVQAQISDLFENEKGREFCKRLLFFPILMAFLNLIASILISVGAYILIPVMAIIYIVLELVVRKLFITNT